MDTEIVLGYWPIRGIGQVPRLLLTYTKANWREKTYFEKDAWYNGDKKKLALSFPNLPYLIDGDLKITESAAINRYIINKSGNQELLGRDPREAAIVDNLLGVYYDIRAAYFHLLFSEKFNEEVTEVPSKIEKKLQYCQNFYDDREFALGYLTLVDFIFAEDSYYIEAISKQLYNKLPFLQRVRNSIEGLPEVQEYYQKENSIKEPFMWAYASLKPRLKP